MTLLTLGGMHGRHDPGGGPRATAAKLASCNDPRNHLEDSELAQVTQVRSGWLANSAEVPGQLQHHESHKAAWLPQLEVS
jgi:hypothetical protein